MIRLISCLSSRIRIIIYLLIVSEMMIPMMIPNVVIYSRMVMILITKGLKNQDLLIS